MKPRADTTRHERLLTVVRLADSDSWRQRLRDPVMHNDSMRWGEELAKRPQALKQPPTILVHLGKYLAQANAWPAAVEVLRRAQHSILPTFGLITG